MASPRWRRVDILLVLAALFVAALAAGLAGSFLGIGGGILLIPFMTLVLGVDIRVATATSLVGVIATSSGAASVYVRDHLTNLRLGMLLEVATTLGAITGALLELLIPQAGLFIVFGVVMFYAATRMIRPQATLPATAASANEMGSLATRMRLGDRAFDDREAATRGYGVTRLGMGFGISAVAGGISGLLGVGGGFIKVPTMNLVMRIPMKAAVATSNFMIGVTAAASAFIYYARGFVDPSLAAMIVLGVFLGTRVGTRLMVRTESRRIRGVFAGLLAGIAVFMVLRAVFPGVGF